MRGKTWCVDGRFLGDEKHATFFNYFFDFFHRDHRAALVGRLSLAGEL